MNATQRYSILGLGVIGTILALFSLLIAPLNWQNFGDMEWQPATLFISAILCGAVQWFVFQQRHYRAAVRMFVVTVAAWSAGLIWYVSDIRSELGCRDHPCSVVVTQRPLS